MSILVEVSIRTLCICLQLCTHFIACIIPPQLNSSHCAILWFCKCFSTFVSFVVFRNYHQERPVIVNLVAEDSQPEQMFHVAGDELSLNRPFSDDFLSRYANEHINSRLCNIQPVSVSPYSVVSALSVSNRQLSISSYCYQKCSIIRDAVCAPILVDMSAPSYAAASNHSH